MTKQHMCILQCKSHLAAVAKQDGTNSAVNTASVKLVLMLIIIMSKYYVVFLYHVALFG